MVIRASHTLLSLVSDVLDFSKMEADKLQLEENSFMLEPLIDVSFETQSIKANDKQLLLNYSIADDVPRKLIGDELRLRQVVTNLVSNAVKFTNKKGGSVELRVRILKPWESEEDVLQRLSGAKDLNTDAAGAAGAVSSLSVAAEEEGRMQGLGLGQTAVTILFEVFDNGVGISYDDQVG